jgi:lipopolysaccharide export system protein LptA
VLEGHTQVKVGDYLISSSKVDMITPANSANPTQISFTGEVFLESKDIDIKSKRMDYDVKLKQMKCYGDGDKVLSTMKASLEEASKPVQPSTISSDYQEFDFIANKGMANGSVIFDSAERDITSEQAYIYFNANDTKGAKKLAAVNLLEKDKRVESNDLQYLPQQKLVRIASNAKILYFTDEQKPIFIFADLVVLETDRQVFSAYSTSRDHHIRLYTDDAYAESRQVVMNQTLDGKPDQAVLTGMAYSQMGDKAVIGEEILFDIAKGTMKTLVNRPQTRIFTSQAQ